MVVSHFGMPPEMSHAFAPRHLASSTIIAPLHLRSMLLSPEHAAEPSMAQGIPTSAIESSQDTFCPCDVQPFGPGHLPARRQCLPLQRTTLTLSGPHS